MTNSTQPILDILSFWHKLEFFIPFDLDNRAQPQNNQKKLWRTYHDASPLLFENPPKGMEVARYTLFLGVFDKSEIRDIVADRESRSENVELDEEQGADLEGLTCMASIGLSADGTPVFDDFNVSTLPWAVGQCRARGIRSLSSDAFHTARSRLAKELLNFEAKRAGSPQDTEGEDISSQLLSPEEVDGLIRLLSDWSGFPTSKDQPAAMLEVVFRKRKSAHNEDPPEKILNEDDEEPPLEIGILNSFYIEDLERAMAIVRPGKTPRALQQYLTPLPNTERIDLYSDACRQQILEALSPRKMNSGRWPSDPEHAMSLMQQFAINTGLSELGKEGLFSVNGPPGTGKTTLLRDLIAENITQRAAVLASLNKPADAFLRKKSGKVAHLIPELTGFEMVVASSNNAAVENISRDLPKGESVWGDDLQYLQPIAHNLAVRGKDGKCRKLSDKELPWGLIAAAMGKKRNRSQFLDGLFFNKVSTRGPKTWSGDERPLTLWEWRKETLPDQDKQQNFRKACEAYKSARKNVETLISEMQSFHDLNALISGHSEESWCRLAHEFVEKQKLSVETATSELNVAEHTRDDQLSEIDDLAVEGQLIERSAPVWWKRLFPTQDARVFKSRLSQNAEAQIELRRKTKQLSTKIKTTLARNKAQAEAALQDAQKKQVWAQDDWRQKYATHSLLKEQFGTISPSGEHTDIETDQIQISGFWHTKELAKLRSDLFKAALQLHEAWLLAVCQTGGGFVDNLLKLSDVLQNRYYGSPEDHLALWQSLFMIVPVISSTFASIARQFEDMGPESIGWLFVDEAGQAVPQAAVGALFRAKRAIVIGDPLQIEPVFTLPKQLISDLANTSPTTASGRYSPDLVSAQALADQANPYGASVIMGDDEPTWIGSPLRVHRRCIDPMFRIANSIAYENRMVFGMPSRAPDPDEAPFLGTSCWIDFPGRVQGRQAVPEQIDFVAKLIVDHHSQFDTLPTIYVISPFKEVKEKLADRLRSAVTWSEFGATPPNESTLKDWLSERVGTVHTFQGKEEDTVIMILGADTQKESAARWAASKPNILNVALTRAKRRFYLVGDRALWGKLRFFQEVFHDLPVESPQSFLCKAKRKWKQLE